MLIAEIGSVHDGSFGNAKKLIKLAAECGADAVKFQTHIASAETLYDAPAPKYFRDEPRYSYFERTGFSLEQWHELSNFASSHEIVFLSSPFSEEAVDLLEEIGMDCYKIPSGEVSNLPLLEYVASKGKPVFLSSGMSNWKELDDAVQVFQDKCKLTVMQCSSAYPCEAKDVGLNVLSEIEARYRTAVGFSDHTLGLAAPIAAAALGASVIEKHLTFSKAMYGSDAQHSMEPDEFKLLAESLKEVWQIMKNPVDKNDVTAYPEMKKTFQKSIVFNEDLSAGTVLKKCHLSFKKPGTGVPAAEYRNIIGQQITTDVRKDQFFSGELVSK